MSASDLNHTKELLTGMAKEATDLRQALGGPITDAVAGWLAGQYFSAAHDNLAGTEGVQRWEVLRAFAQDWAQLRHGDHTAERLRIERERLDLAKEDAQKKWKPKIEAGLDALAQHIRDNPQAGVAYAHFKAAVLAGEKPSKAKEFREWIQDPENRKEVFSELTRGLSPETLEKIERELKLL